MRSKFRRFLPTARTYTTSADGSSSGPRIGAQRLPVPCFAKWLVRQLVPDRIEEKGLLCGGEKLHVIANALGKPNLVIDTFGRRCDSASERAETGERELRACRARTPGRPLRWWPHGSVCGRRTAVRPPWHCTRSATARRVSSPLRHRRRGRPRRRRRIHHGVWDPARPTAPYLRHNDSRLPLRCCAERMAMGPMAQCAGGRCGGLARATL
jgi:hypothetical protein